MSYDISRINQAQAKILNSIILFEQKYGKKGATQYELDKKLGKKERVAGSTFNENISILEKLGLISRVYDRNNKHHQWSKKKHRTSYPYTITEFGVFAYLKSLSEKKNLTTENSSLIPYLPDLIKNHWNELEKIFGESLPILLEESIDQISVVRTHVLAGSLDKILSLLGKLLEERITFYFPETNIRLMLLNRYDLLKPGDEVIIKKHFNVTISSKFNNYTMNQLSFVFYFNLLRLHIDSDHLQQMSFSCFVRKFPKISTNINEEIQKMDEYRAFFSSFSRKMPNASKKVMELISNNEELSNLMKKSLKEISTRFKVPSFLESVTRMF